MRGSGGIRGNASCAVRRLLCAAGSCVRVLPAYVYVYIRVHVLLVLCVGWKKEERGKEKEGRGKK